MRVALVHEFLTQLGGAERVLQCFHEMFPDAPVYTLVYDEKATRGAFAKWDIRTSYIQRMPGSPAKYKWYLPLMSRAVEGFDFSSYDLVLSDSSAFAKGVRTERPTAHICYCHTPTRYLWIEMEDYISSLPYSSLIKWSVRRYLRYYLRGWDAAAARRPDVLVANSRVVRERIKRYYERDSEVVYPPIDTDFFTIGGEKKKEPEYFFTASRLEPYKKIGLVVKAFSQLGLPLKVAGSGTEYENLRRIARPNVEFLGRVSDMGLRDLYRGANAFVFPALEDSGLMVLEALSTGVPVIAYGQGGTVEFVRDGVNGVLFPSQSVDAVVAAVERFKKLKFEPEALRETALAHGKRKFQENIFGIIDKIMVNWE